MRAIRARALAAAVLVAACARQDQTPSESRAVGEARVRELEQQVRALAKTDGCDRADQCAVAPVGAKPCGGPRTYVVYCKATTDEAALTRALAQLKSAEEAHNREAGLMSDCSVAPQPGVRLDGRTCTAVTP